MAGGGVLPPDKPKLNRKKYIEEARKEWNARDKGCYVWDYYIMEAISYMLPHAKRRTSRASLEAVGVAKVLKLALRLRQFSEDLKEEGKTEYKIIDQYEYVKDILEA